MNRASAMWRFASRARKPLRGQAVTEIATGALVFMVMAIGLLDFGPAIVATAQLSQAARGGADYAHTSPNDTAGIRARVKQAAPRLGLTDPAITVTCFSGTGTTTKTCSSAALGDTVRIDVNYSYVPTTGLFNGLFGGSLALARSAATLVY